MAKAKQQKFKPLRQELLEEVDSFLETTGMAITTFGILAANNGKLITDMRNNAKRSIRLETADDIRAFMRSYKNTNNTPTASSVSKDGGAIG